jgi:hypothetical protein
LRLLMDNAQDQLETRALLNSPIADWIAKAWDLSIDEIIDETLALLSVAADKEGLRKKLVPIVNVFSTLDEALFTEDHKTKLAEINATLAKRAEPTSVSTGSPEGTGTVTTSPSTEVGSASDMKMPTSEEINQTLFTFLKRLFSTGKDGKMVKFKLKKDKNIPYGSPVKSADALSTFITNFRDAADPSSYNLEEFLIVLDSINSKTCKLLRLLAMTLRQAAEDPTRWPPKQKGRVLYLRVLLQLMDSTDDCHEAKKFVNQCEHWFNSYGVDDVALPGAIKHLFNLVAQTKGEKKKKFVPFVQAYLKVCKSDFYEEQQKNIKSAFAEYLAMAENKPTVIS